MMTSLISTFGVDAHCKEPSFFGLETWYHFLKTDANCNVINFQFLPANGQSDVLLVALAIVDDLLRIGGLVAIAFVIYGGFQYVTSQGSPENTQKAQSTIQNALIGLVISILAISVVAFLGTRIG